MVALPVAADRFAPLLAALTRRRALFPILMLPAHLRMDPDDVATLLDDAVDAGLAEIWDEAPGAPCAILSASAARKRGLELVTDALSRDDRFRWVPRREVKPERSHMLTESNLRDPETGHGGFDQMPDYGPSGVEVVMVDVTEDPKFTPYLEKAGISVATVGRGEGRADGHKRAATSMRFNPRMILGLRVQWPVPDLRDQGGLAIGVRPESPPVSGPQEPVRSDEFLSKECQRRPSQPPGAVRRPAHLRSGELNSASPNRLRDCPARLTSAAFFAAETPGLRRR